MHDDIWRHIVRIHQEAKNLILKAEEFDRNFRSFLPPIFEQRNALEHIIRVRAAQLGLHRSGDEDYIKDSLRKALGHEYRTFFDAADWLAVRIREKVQDLLSGYSAECIKEVIPDYYSRMRPGIEQACEAIAEIRGEKDISRGNEALVEVERYKKEIDDLLKTHKHLLTCVPALEDYSSRTRVSRRAAWFWGLVAVIITAAIGVLLGWLLPDNSDAQPAEETPPPAAEAPVE